MRKKQQNLICDNEKTTGAHYLRPNINTLTSAKNKIPKTLYLWTTCVR